MRFGPKCEPGSLPVFSVDTEEEARSLLSLACERNMRGEYVARELVVNQTLENLQKFSDRLAAVWEWMHSDKREPFPQPPPMFEFVTKRVKP